MTPKFVELPIIQALLFRESLQVTYEFSNWVSVDRLIKALALRLGKDP